MDVGHADPGYQSNVANLAEDFRHMDLIENMVHGDRIDSPMHANVVCGDVADYTNHWH